ncbi:MAG UNVERIFIED_CONTAM: hypothetical protein LVR18_21120 [Planctomycetaceae bacterium]
MRTKRWTNRARGERHHRSSLRGRSSDDNPRKRLLRHADSGKEKKKKEAKKGTAAKAAGGKKPGKTFTIGGVKPKLLCTFTRQLSTLQDAGLLYSAASASSKAKAAPEHSKMP